MKHPTSSRPGSASTAFMAAMDAMSAAMPEMTGNPDRDFMAMMIPHHQSAIAMAEAVLKHGSDPSVLKLATDIAAAQKAEIAVMQGWLDANPVLAAQSVVSTFKAISATMSLPEDGSVPEWVHLLPAGGDIRTFDGRGPYQLRDAAALIATSMSSGRLGNELPIDENHSTDHKAAGGEAPARGWIKALEARADGIWGRVEWTAAGRALVADKSYRGISPVFLHDAEGRVHQLLRAALTNQPNLLGLAVIHQETSVDLITQLRTKRGLPATATEAEVLADVPAKGSLEPALQSTMTALQSTVAQIATAVGGDAANLPALLAAVSAKATQAATAADAQTQLANLSTQVAAMQTASKRAASELYVDSEIANKRDGLSAKTREHWVTLHMEQPQKAKEMIDAMFCMAESHTGAAPPGRNPTQLALNAEQQGRALHDRAVAYQSEQKVKGLNVSLFDAITHVNKEVQQ